MKLGFIILAHNQPAALRHLAENLAKDGDRVIIHFDSGAAKSDLLAVQQIAADLPDQVQVISKVKGVWGEWSLVEAVLLSLQEYTKLPEPPAYIHLMSGADLPLRPLDQLKDFLTANPELDFIECHDISKQSWVKGGLSIERFQYYFPVNFKTHRKLFDRLVRWHRKLKIRRRMPLGLKPHMGSQWWTLRWSTCQKVLGYTKAHPEVPRFFKSTWIPDESYFQTIIAKVVPKREIANLQLMFHHLTPTGRPYTFYNDHKELVCKLPHFFIRKVSPQASELWDHICNLQPRRKRMPSLKLLHKTRNLIQSRIDANHKLTTTVPGYHDLWYAPELKAYKRPLVLLFITDDSVLPQLEQTTRSNPAFCWLGKPFTNRHIGMPSEALERIGMTRESAPIRDNFKQQFIYHLVTSTPRSQTPVAVLALPEDQPDWHGLTQLENIIPIMVIEPSLNNLHLSRALAVIHNISPEIMQKTVHIALEQLPSAFINLAGDFKRWQAREIQSQLLRDSLLPEDPQAYTTSNGKP